MFWIFRKLFIVILYSNVLSIYGQNDSIDILINLNNIDSICSCNCNNRDSSNIDSQQTILVVEESPIFQNGDINTFREFIQDCLNDLDLASTGKRDKVIIQFAIEIDGTLTDIRIIRCNNVNLAKEAIKCMTKSPKWTPGKMKGKNVKTMFLIPVTSTFKQTLH